MLKYYPILLFIPLIFSIVSCDEHPYKQGAILYTNFCANCHMDDGTGLQGLIPPLAEADFVRDNQDKLACIIRKGMEGPVVVNGRTYDQPMVGFEELSDFEIANIVNYINHSWGNNYGFYKLADARENLQECD